MKIFFRFIILMLCCLSVIHAHGQALLLPPTDPSAPTMPNAPVNSITVPGSSTTGPNPRANEAARRNSPGKYDEYQSICRERDYDRVAYVDKETQDKRIAHLKEKISSTLANTKLKLRLLKEYIDQNRLDEAIDLHSKLKNENLIEEDEKMADAMGSLTRNEKSKARDLLSAVVISNPKNKEALTYLAEVYLSQKNYFEAIAAYSDLAKLTKISYDEELCEANTLHSQHKEAEVFCRRAVKDNPKSPFPYLYLGVSHRERLQYKEAIENFEKSLKIKPTEMGYTCLAEVYYIQEKNSEAVNQFRKSLDHMPSSSRAHIGLAWAEFKNKQFDEALVTFTSLCKKDRRFKTEIRKAYKALTDANSPFAKKFADATFACPD